MNKTMKKFLEIHGWVWIFVFVIIGVLSAGLHVADHFSSVADHPGLANVLEQIYGKEFFQHWLDFREYPVARMIHMVLGIAFVLIAPLQFVPRVRKAFPRVHKVIGRLSLAFSVVLFVTAWIFAFNITYTGLQEQIPTVTYTVIYAWLIYMALKNIRAGNVARHREWMIRAFAMMMGISATRVWFALFLKTTETTSDQFFSSILWLGLGVNLLIAEIWINLTRPAQASSPRVERRPAVGVDARAMG